MITMMKMIIYDNNDDDNGDDNDDNGFSLCVCVCVLILVYLNIFFKRFKITKKKTEEKHKKNKINKN